MSNNERKHHSSEQKIIILFRPLVGEGDDFVCGRDVPVHLFSAL